MKIDFVLAQEKDLNQIVATYNSSIPGRLATADLEPVSVESKIVWFREHRADFRPLYLVNYGGEYAGWMSFSSFYGRPAYNATAEISIYLESSFQGKGIGKRCLMQAESVAPKIGVKNLLGFIFGHNTPSLNLFFSMGYERWALLPGIADMDGEFRDLIILGKKL